MAAGKGKGEQRLIRWDSKGPNTSERLMKYRYSLDSVRTGEVPASAIPKKEKLSGNQT